MTRRAAIALAALNLWTGLGFGFFLGAVYTFSRLP